MLSFFVTFVARFSANFSPEMFVKENGKNNFLKCIGKPNFSLYLCSPGGRSTGESEWQMAACKLRDEQKEKRTLAGNDAGAALRQAGDLIKSSLKK